MLPIQISKPLIIIYPPPFQTPDTKLRVDVEHSDRLTSSPDRASPRWFSPLDAGSSRLPNSPLLLYLPGIGGSGFGLSLHHQRLGEYRLNEEKAEWIIYVTDAAKSAEWLPVDESKFPKTSHVGFCLVLGDDGKRFRTRCTEVVRLVDLLAEAKTRCKVPLEERGKAAEWTAEELEQTAEVVGYGAVKRGKYYCRQTVVGSAEETSRLLLCDATAVVMRKCFHLLGITPVYKI